MFFINSLCIPLSVISNLDSSSLHSFPLTHVAFSQITQRERQTQDILTYSTPDVGEEKRQRNSERGKTLDSTITVDGKFSLSTVPLLPCYTLHPFHTYKHLKANKPEVSIANLKDLNRLRSGSVLRGRSSTMYQAVFQISHTSPSYVYQADQCGPPAGALSARRRRPPPGNRPSTVLPLKAALIHSN